MLIIFILIGAAIGTVLAFTLDSRKARKENNKLFKN